MISRISQHLSLDLQESVKDLVMEHKYIFIVRLGADPPVQVPAIDTQLEATERPVKFRKRAYSAEQLTFLIEELVDSGYIYRNNSSKCSCSPLIVAKPGKEG